MILRFGFLTALYLLGVEGDGLFDRLHDVDLSKSLVNSSALPNDRDLGVVDINTMQDKDYLLDLSEVSVINGFDSEYHDIAGKGYRSFKSSIFEPFATYISSEKSDLEKTVARKNFLRKCDEDDFITFIKAEYMASKKDHTYMFKCSSSPLISKIECDWSHYVNQESNHKNFTFKCEANKAIAGFQSIYVQKNNDRVFSFYCCGMYEGEWDKERAENFVEKGNGEDEVVENYVTRYFGALPDYKEKCDSFRKNFDVSVCEMDAGSRKDNRRGFFEDKASLNSGYFASDRSLPNNDKTKKCIVEHLSQPLSANSHHRKVIRVLSADSVFNMDSAAYDKMSSALLKLEICTESLLQFEIDFYEVDVEVNSMNWIEASHKVMSKAKEDFDIDFANDLREDDGTNSYVDFSLNKYLTMVVVPDDVDFGGDIYSFALLHSGFSVIKSSQTYDAKVIIHEIGHNLGMKHSTTENDEYGDSRCAMGDSRNDRTCFNGAKSFYLGLYRQDTAIVHAYEYHCDADILLADSSSYVRSKRRLYRKFGIFYVVINIPEHDLFFMYYKNDEKISITQGGIGTITTQDNNHLYYAKKSKVLHELGRNDLWEYNGVYFRHCKYEKATETANLLISSDENLTCPSEYLGLEDSEISERFSKVYAKDYVSQRGQHIVHKDGQPMLGYVNNGDFASYKLYNFGRPGDTKFITFRYSKGGFSNGVVDIRLDKVDGRLIGTFHPRSTGSYWRFIEESMSIDDVHGVHSIVLVARAQDNRFIWDLDWFRLSTNPHPKRMLPKVYAKDYLYQHGTGISTAHGHIGVGWQHDGDYMIYEPLNFGKPGSTKYIRFRYSKGRNSGGRIEVRLDGINGQLIGTFHPLYTGSWAKFIESSIEIKNVHGVHSVALVIKGGHDVSDMHWFRLSRTKYGSGSLPSALFSKVYAKNYLSTYGTWIIFLNGHYNVGNVKHGHFMLYEALNFGDMGTTNFIQVCYSKGVTTGGIVEIRLDGVEGQVIGTINPQYTGDWHNFIQSSIKINDVEGYHYVAFVGKDSSDYIFDLYWFKLSKTA